MKGFKMYILFELTEMENGENVVRRPIGIYETVKAGFKWIRENYESYKDVFRDGEEQVYYENEDTKTVQIKYVGGCQPGNFEATYVMREYKIGQTFEDIMLFDQTFYNDLSNAIENF